ncbi:multidrug resistance-associated protein [Penicillium macrosclerotiorum]|uniref:multidrug resistance-associated protein n=1 Tax=Penicillium macrosclerotiorum TaxID=303699 RepID=UPI002546B759|nr:multidrug resistance-associated protein [Penicillium macrosclerotiorum]KAJ5675349.1 multidrug resistance-associated protein [Penicillium macrosclerotiorum]
MMASQRSCINTDNQFGPRVSPDCRDFDFTLLFEDAFFAILPSSLFLLLLPARLGILRKASVKASTLKVAVYKLVTQERLVGFWGRGLFLWLNPTFRLGYSKVLSIAELPELDQDLQGDAALQKLEIAWLNSQPQSRLIKAVFRAYSQAVFFPVIPRLALSAFKFCQPFLITSTINYFEIGRSDSTAKSKDYGGALIGAYLLVYLGMAISTAIYRRLTYRLITMARAGLMSMIYAHTTELKSRDVKDTAALTLMGTDVERIVESLKSLHETWASIVEVAVALFLLERQIFLACLVPACICMVCASAAGPVSTRTAPAQKAWVERVQIRLAVTSAFLGNMKAVKMLGVKEPLFGLVTRLREAELKTSSRFRRLLIWTIVLFQSNRSVDAVSFKNANISWSIGGEPVLKNLTLDISEGLTVIIGPVGSGKSALIAAILGESVVSGTSNVPVSSVAYCQQIPWLVNDTIQKNIIGGSRLIPSETMPGGSMYVIGSNGVSLSGGQKQRVALARAIYSRLRFTILDDPFSGLDSRCIDHISSTLFARGGYFRESGRTVILATHNRKLLQFADEAIVLNDGKVVKRGSAHEIMMATSEIVARSLMEDGAKQGGAGQTVDEPDETCDKVTEAGQIQENADTQRPDFSRRDGSWQVYRYYVRSAGILVSFSFVTSFTVSTFLSKFSTIWIEWWSDSNAKAPNAKVGFYLGIYSAFTILNTSCFVLGCYQDIDLIDMRLPVWVVNTVANGFQTLMNLVILCVVGKYMAVFLPVLILAFFFIQLYYLRTSRQMRLLEIEAKAPLYTIFTDTLSGVATIKAFGWQNMFRADCQKQLNNSQKPFYTLLCIQQWLNLVLDLVVAAMAVILLAITTSFKDRFSGGVMGVALNLILTLNQSLVRTIQSWTQLETSIGAVSRIQEFQKSTPSEARIQLSNLPTVDDWPSEGKICLEGVSASYHPNSPPILKDLSMVIDPGTKVAVCGPSGSGKTTLIMTLLRMVKIQDGNVLIDGNNLNSIEPNHIRLRLNVISQESFFIPGTLRFNLDFHERLSDASIESAIKKVGLWKRVDASGGLDMPMEVSDWSAGEKQLLALARALNVQSPILILDEATSRCVLFSINPDIHLG